MPFGELRKVSHSSYVLEINDFANVITRRHFDLYSPIFKFLNEAWCLNFRNYEAHSGGVRTHFRLFRFCEQDPCTQTYSLCVRDVEGDIYWSYCSHWGPPRDLQASDLLRDSNRIAPAGVLSLHLTFDPPSGQLPSPREGIEKLSQNFKNMFLDGHDCDVTLNVRGRKFEAHQLILKCRWPVFSDVFRQDMARNGGSVVVNFPDCDPDVFHDFLLYLYSGKLERLSTTSVVHLHYIGRKYGVKELVEVCVKYMIANLAVECFCDFVTVGLVHSELDLMERADAFFAKNIKKIVATEKWRVFSLENSTNAHVMLNKALEKCRVPPEVHRRNQPPTNTINE